MSDCNYFHHHNIWKNAVMKSITSDFQHLSFIEQKHITNQLHIHAIQLCQIVKEKGQEKFAESISKQLVEEEEE